MILLNLSIDGDEQAIHRANLYEDQLDASILQIEYLHFTGKLDAITIADFFLIPQGESGIDSPKKKNSLTILKGLLRKKEEHKIEENNGADGALHTLYAYMVQPIALVLQEEYNSSHFCPQRSYSKNPSFTGLDSRLYHCIFTASKNDVMKKALVIIGYILFAGSTAFAQIQKIERPAIIKKVIPPPPSNLPAGKDLSISIKSFQYDPANGGAIHVTYVVKNNGADPVDLNNVAVQGYIDDPVIRPTATMPTYPVNGKNYYAGGGQAIASFSTILNGGQEKENTLHCFNLAKEHYFNSGSNYNYILLVDKANIISETNETNNSVSWSFRGYEGQYNPAVNPSQYYLTDAFITIKTGADNKEKESEVSIRVIPSLIKNLSDDHNEFIKKLAKNELELYSNSPRTLPLALFMASTYTTVNPPTSLASFLLNGLGTVIEYKANIFTDAWKIEQVELVLHFKDANGIYHPTQGVKIIQFNMPANTFLDGITKHYLVCKADAALNPVSIKTIEKLSAY